MRTIQITALTVLAGLFLFGQSTCASASEGFDDLAKLAKAGVTEEVLLAFVNASPIAYELSIDEILYLNDLGVDSKAIAAIVEHGKAIHAGVPPADAAAVAPPKLPGDAKADAVDAANAPADVAKAVPVEKVVAPPQDNANGPVPIPGGENSPAPVPFLPLDGNAPVAQETIQDGVNAPVTVVAPDDGSINTSTFYETLTPYGTWIRFGDTWCWQPSATVCNANWRPYCDHGHWLWTDCGWCWQSDYSWGWAPFHYGRWEYCDGYGWVWAPDCVWAPAWVSWRECDSHIGWAPLPWACHFHPGEGFRFRGGLFQFDIGFGLGFNSYCFVPSHRFTETGLRHHLATRGEAEALFNRSTLIQNNLVVESNRLTLHGPSVTNLEKLTGHTIYPLRIDDAKINAGQSLTRTAREDQHNGVLHLYRPEVKATAATETPATVAKQQLAAFEASVKTLAHSNANHSNDAAISKRADEIRQQQLEAQQNRRQTLDSNIHVFTQKGGPFELQQQNDQHNNNVNRFNSQQNTTQDSTRRVEGERNTRIDVQRETQTQHAQTPHESHVETPHYETPHYSPPPPPPVQNSNNSTNDGRRR
ncbi:MAG TPA: DUF6600 domain-containing protein [Planctomycetota bacterium]|nr:DUF6600 domain-containing protein [Planctomycetota bacterium]